MEEKNTDIFPIKTATSCQFKWTWSTIFLPIGSSSSCHRCKGWDVSENMQDFHNHPGKIKDRENMLEGKWPGNGCEYCKKVEDAGGQSERTSFINDLHLSPKELIDNPTATSVTPRIIEIYFNNLCNQKCVYCSPFFSSSIENEIEKFGPLETEYDLDGFKSRDDYHKLKADFWIWMEKNSKELYQFQILGGEPMYQPEFMECLEYLENREHPKLNWKIFSNLKHNPIKFKEKIDRITKLIEYKKIKSFEIVCSQDSWGPQAEYARFGMDLVEWEENFNTLLYSPSVLISIHSTITPLTLPTMAEFYRRIFEWKKIKNINFGWNTVANPIFMNPEIIGHYTQPFFDELLSVIPDNEHRKEYLEGFKTQIVSHPVDPQRLKRLSDYLDRIDIRRDTNWRLLHPWLVDVCNKEITDDIQGVDLSNIRVSRNPNKNISKIVENLQDLNRKK